MGTTVNIQLGPHSQSIYANFAAVQFTPTELILRFCLIDPMLPTEQNEETGSIESVDVPVAISVFLSPETAESLAGILAKQIQQRNSQLQKDDEKCTPEG